MNVFAHTGDIGDCVASLPAIRALGGGKLLIGFRRGGQRESMHGARFNAIKPLIEAQDYITSVEWTEDFAGVTHDLSTFRRACSHHDSLAHWHGRHLNVQISTAPWLKVEPSEQSKGRAVIARSPRYHNPDFPWRELLRKHPTAMFVGLPPEHVAFQREIPCRIQFVHTQNLLQLAALIAGSELFIANQSSPMWIAMGLGVPLIQETSPRNQNSIIRRPNAQFVLKAGDLK